MQFDRSGRAEIQSMKNSRARGLRRLRSAHRGQAYPESQRPLTSSRDNRRDGERGQVVSVGLAPVGVDQAPEPPPRRTWRVERKVGKPARSGGSRLPQILAARGDGCVSPEPSMVCQTLRDYIRVDVGNRRVRLRTTHQRFAGHTLLRLSAWGAAVAAALDGCPTQDDAKRIRLAGKGGDRQTPRR